MTWFWIEQRTVSSISSKSNSDSGDEAPSQGAKLIFLNATTDESGSYFSQYCLNTSNSFTIGKSLEVSIDLIKNTNDFVPLVFSATSFRLSYYIDVLATKIPVISVDHEKKVDRDKHIELLQQL